MSARNAFTRMLFIGLAIALVGGIGLAQEPGPGERAAPQAQVGTAFTYQGRLTDGGSPANGSYDFRFILYDAQSGGSQVGSTVSKENVSVADGFFTVALDFGASAFTGDARYLEIGVRTGSSTGSYTTLLPRQALTPAPYALYALNTDISGGVHVLSTTGDGLRVDSADDDGVHLDSVGDDGVHVESAEDNGLQLDSVDGDGVHVSFAGDDGMHVDWANDNALQINGAGGDGVHVSDADGHAGYFDGSVRVTGDLTKGAGGFKIDHPLDPENKYLQHSFVESPDMMNVYNGNVTLDANGEAWVELPAWFGALNQDFRYQLTPIGAPGPDLYIAEEVQDNRFEIAGGEPGMKVSWQVSGIRHDPYAEAHRILVEEDKPPEEQGTYLHPQAYGLPETMKTAYEEMPSRQAQPPVSER